MKRLTKKKFHAAIEETLNNDEFSRSQANKIRAATKKTNRASAVEVESEKSANRLIFKHFHRNSFSFLIVVSC